MSSVLNVFFCEGAATSFQTSGMGEAAAVPLLLEYGPLTEDVLGDVRETYIRQLWQNLPDGVAAAAAVVETAKHSLDRIREQCQQQRTVRVWADWTAGSMCGLTWLGWTLGEDAESSVQIAFVPSWRSTDGTWQKSFLQEVPPDGWQMLQPQVTAVDAPLRLLLQRRWAELLEQNTDLRALAAGELLSVPPYFYDFLITQTAAAAPETFSEAWLIGRVLRVTGASLSDAWLAQRIDHLISAGQLAVLEAPENPDGPLLIKTPALMA